jgi:hypothetical protein
VKILSTQNTISVDGFFEVLRQRLFLDHSPEVKTFVNDEYTIRSNNSKLTNIILEYPDFLPNLTVFDSDGEELPILPKAYVKTLIQIWINRSKDDEKTQFENLLSDIEDGKKYLIWIKLPEDKKLKMNEIKVFTLQYSAQKEESRDEDYILKIISPNLHSVYHIIKVPEDYTFSNQKIILHDTEGKQRKIKKSWKKHKDVINVAETHDSLSINPNPKITKTISLTYSFKPKWPITSFPYSVIAFLSISAGYVAYLDFCPDCTFLVFQGSELLLQKQFEISLAVVGASLVLPRLIKNDFVRHSMLTWYYAPIIISIFLIVF